MALYNSIRHDTSLRLAIPGSGICVHICIYVVCLSLGVSTKRIGERGVGKLKHAFVRSHNGRHTRQSSTLISPAPSIPRHLLGVHVAAIRLGQSTAPGVGASVQVAWMEFLAVFVATGNDDSFGSLGMG